LLALARFGIEPDLETWSDERIAYMLCRIARLVPQQDREPEPPDPRKRAGYQGFRRIRINGQER